MFFGVDVSVKSELHVDRTALDNAREHRGLAMSSHVVAVARKQIHKRLSFTAGHLFDDVSLIG